MSTTTYLQVVNQVLRELNEVVLTSSTFASAVNIQAYVKDCVVRALYDINSQHYKWPFLAASNSTEPHLGNTYVDVSQGTRWYLLKTGSADVDNDYAYVDWDTFVLTTEGIAGETTPYTITNLVPITLEEWERWRSETEAQDEANTQAYGVPKFVIKNTDGRRFGLSPIPKQGYRIYFYAWNQITVPTLHSSTFQFQEQYIPALLSRTRYYVWQYKGDYNNAQLAENDWKFQMRRMREQLLETKPVTKFTDTRRMFI